MPTPSISTTTTTVPSTGVNSIDALLTGVKWGSSVQGGITLTYSFPWSSGNSTFSGRNGSSSYSTLDEPNASLHYALTTEQQQAARTAMQAWSNVANVQFTEVADNSSVVGDIRMGWTSVEDKASTGAKAWGWTYDPSSAPHGGDIWISTVSSGAKNPDWSVGSYNYEAIVHELGHALGLKHPFEDGVILPTAIDTRQYTIMAYQDISNDMFRTITYDSAGKPDFHFFYVAPETPMVLDIAAMQLLYGANMNYKTGNDVYTFDTNKAFLKTIWDAGGNDTISVANFSLGCKIDLTPGNYSDIRMISAPNPPGFTGGTVPDYLGIGNLGIAYGTYIENAIGGAGDDTLIGNALNNTLTGNGGNDTIDGGQGQDTVIFSGARSNYTITASGNSATVKAKTGTDGNDSLANIERLHFTDENVALDINGTAGQAYRLYQAAFDRKPDMLGLGYWIADMDKGSDLTTVAAGFMKSAEFQKLYGTSPSNATLVTNFYQNVLHRAADQDGFNYWLDQLNTHKITAAGALASFCEGIENQVRVIGAIQNGIDYSVWTG
ncbi:DUF4214 domain-containing protein [Undibacterium sp. TJN19]|uniref:DUF4214 domain-containing protein n=1 Tax=Undibacterium sp. TJN19 TaxID=3413055 RepID=UPI003BF1B971